MTSEREVAACPKAGNAVSKTIAGARSLIDSDHSASVRLPSRWDDHDDERLGPPFRDYSEPRSPRSRTDELRSACYTVGLGRTHGPSRRIPVTTSTSLNLRA